MIQNCKSKISNLVNLIYHPHKDIILWNLDNKFYAYNISMGEFECLGIPLSSSKIVSIQYIIEHSLTNSSNKNGLYWIISCLDKDIFVLSEESYSIVCKFRLDKSPSCLRVSYINNYFVWSDFQGNLYKHSINDVQSVTNSCIKLFVQHKINHPDDKTNQKNRELENISQYGYLRKKNGQHNTLSLTPHLLPVERDKSNEFISDHLDNDFTDSVLYPFATHMHPVNNIHVTLDESYIISTDNINRIRIGSFKLPQYTHVFCFDHTDTINCIESFVFHNRFVFCSCSDDQYLYLWDLDKLKPNNLECNPIVSKLKLAHIPIKIVYFDALKQIIVSCRDTNILYKIGLTVNSDIDISFSEKIQKCSLPSNPFDIILKTVPFTFLSSTVFSKYITDNELDSHQSFIHLLFWIDASGKLKCPYIADTFKPICFIESDENFF